MKILQILPELNFGGVEVGAVDLAEALVNAGHKAYVISAGGELVGRLVKMGVQHYTLPVHKKSFRSFLMIHKVRKIIEREGIDIVHARSRIPAWIAYFATRKSRAKFVTTCHGMYRKHLLSRVMGWGENVIVISHAVGRRMIDAFGVIPDRITLIHRGLDINKCVFDKTKYESKEFRAKGKYVVAIIGRLSPIKGHDVFIKAIHLVSHQFPQVEAWIVGGTSSRKQKYAEQLKTLVSKLGMTSMIQFVGVERNVPELLKKVDMLVLATTYPEGFGRVIIEAGASGVAVVATQVGGVLDIVTDGENGLLVPPHDEVKMAKAIMRYLENPSLAKSCAQNLRKKVEAQFTVGHLAEKTMEVYKKVRATRRILVMKLGALGDIILVVPSLRMIRKKYPQAYIAVLVDVDLSTCLENCPYIDDIISFKRKDKKNAFRNIMRVVKKIKKGSFDLSVDFQNNNKTHVIAFLARIPARYGYRRGIFGGLLTHGVGSYKDPLPPVRHQFRVLNLLGISKYNDELELWPLDEDRSYITRVFHEAQISQDQKMIGFVLGASERWNTKKWAIEKFVILAEKISRTFHAHIVLIGDNHSQEERNAFLSLSNVKVLDMVGRTTVMQLAALMKELSCVITSDTAPLHVASAMGTKIIALFGPTDPRRHMPPGTRHIVLKHTLACSPCYKERCTTGRCMKEISVEEVFEAVRKQLES